MLAARLISFLAVVSMLAQPLLAEKCAVPSYSAPYNLGDTAGELKTSSVVNAGSVYYIVPCGTVNQGLCADSNATEQECYAYTDKQGKEQSDSLGQPMNSTWSAVDNKWYNGATSVNKDIKVGDTTTLCDATLDGSFTTVYHCATGDDSTTLVHEPQSMTDACVFEIHVDSSVLCKYQKSVESSSSSSSTGSESSSSSLESSSSMDVSSSSESSSSMDVSSSSESSSSARSSSAVHSSSSSAESSSAVSSSSAHAASSSSAAINSSSSGMPIMSSSSDMPMDSSSSEVVISSSSFVDSSSTGEDAGDSGWSTAAEVGVGLGVGLGSLVIILLVALIYFIRKLHNTLAEKNALLVDDAGSTSGRSYNSLKNTEEGRGSKKSKNDRLI